MSWEILQQPSEIIVVEDQHPDTWDTHTELEQVSNELDPFFVIDLTTPEGKALATENAISWLKLAAPLYGILADSIAKDLITNYLQTDSTNIMDGQTNTLLTWLAINTLLSTPKPVTIFGVDFDSIAEYLESTRILLTSPEKITLQQAKDKIDLERSNGSIDEDPADTYDQATNDTNAQTRFNISNNSVEFNETSAQKWFSSNQLNSIRQTVPFVSGQCSWNVRRWLYTLKKIWLTNFTIPILGRAEEQGTLIRKTFWMPLSPGETQNIDETLAWAKEALDFSKETNTNNYTSRANKINNMKWNVIVLALTNKYPVAKRGKGYPGHASVAFRGSDGKFYVHDESFTNHNTTTDWEIKLDKNLFPLEAYLQKTCGWYTSYSWSRNAYNLDAVVSGNISIPENMDNSKLKNVTQSATIAS